MLSVVDFRVDDKVLDLGCGYGVVGIAAAMEVPPERVFMVDSDPLAVELAERNAQLNHVPNIRVSRSNGFRELGEAGFTKILVNPPYHVDFAVPKEFVHKGFNRLSIGGQFIMVTKRRVWYRNKLIGIFGGVRIADVDGYCIFTAVKKATTYAKVLDPRFSKPRNRQRTEKEHTDAAETHLRRRPARSREDINLHLPRPHACQ